jgi:hypothetical protein
MNSTQGGNYLTPDELAAIVRSANADSKAGPAFGGVMFWQLGNTSTPEFLASSKAEATAMIAGINTRSSNVKGPFTLHDELSRVCSIM